MINKQTLIALTRLIDRPENSYHWATALYVNGRRRYVVVHIAYSELQELVEICGLSQNEVMLFFNDNHVSFDAMTLVDNLGISEEDLFGEDPDPTEGMV